jgi:tetratricopeptide (TPR) repeat protein
VLRSIGKFVLALLIAVPVLTLLYLYPPGSRSPKAQTVAPAHVNVADAAGGVEVAWHPVPGAFKYTVFWGTARGEYKNLFDTTLPKVVLSNLRKGELYYFAVTTWTSTGESNYSQEQLVVHDDVPSHAKTHLAKANEFMGRDAYQEAYAHISTAIRLAPNDPDGYKDRALLYEKIARPDLAKQDHAMAERLYGNKPISLIPARRSQSY